MIYWKGRDTNQVPARWELFTTAGQVANQLKWTGTNYRSEIGDVLTPDFSEAKEGAILAAIEARRITGDDIPDRFRKGKRKCGLRMEDAV